MSIVPPQQLYHRVLGPDFQVSGNTPIVFLHGLMGFAANWGKIWPQFQTNHPVLVLDQRGHGRSAKPETGYSPSDYAEDLAALLQHLGWKKIHVVGHSMGGRVALRFASLFPDRCSSLIMEDSGTESRPDRLLWIRNLLAGTPTPFATRESAKEFFEKNYANDPMTGGFLHANLETKENGTLDWRFHAPGMIETVETGRATDATEEIRSLSCPTLLIRGGRSKEFTADEAARMQALRPSIKLVEIAGAGHFVHAEKPTEFSAALTNFLAAL